MEPVFDACKLAEGAGATFVGREATLQTPALKDLLKAAISHKGFSVAEVLSDCTEIFGRKNALGNSAEMVLKQKHVMIPEHKGNRVADPFRPNPFPSGVFVDTQRAEYGELYEQVRKRARGETS
jgi:2-oxoglutarate ferredoxin oxidoreductase subunit beta